MNTDKPTKPQLVSSLLLAGLACTAVAYGQENEPVKTQLSETVLTAELSEDGSGILTNANQVSGDVLDKWGSEDLEGIFKTTLGARAGGGRTQSQDIFIQGIQTTMTNVTIDGAPQTGLIFYHAGSGGSIEQDLLKSVTVSAGTSNALSGPGALGGALAYETKDGFDLLDAGQSVGGTAKATYYADRDSGYKLNAMGYGLLSQDWSYLVSLGYSDIGNYTDGNGVEVIDTKYKRESALAKVSGNFGDAHSLSVSYEFIQDEGAGGARFNVYPGEASDLANFKERNTVTLDYGFNPAANDLLDLSLTLYNTERTLEGSGNVAGIESTGLDLRNVSTSGDAGFKIAYGMDYREDTYGSSRVDADEVGTINGFYTQMDWDVSESVLLSAGARYDFYELDSRDGSNFDQSGFSPNATVIYDLSENVSLHATYAEAFRGVYPVQSYLTNSETVADIAPEESENIEFGVEYQFNNGYYVAAKVFDTSIDNVINPRPRGTPRANLGDFASDGYEIMFGGSYEKLHFSIGTIDTDPKVTTPDGSVYDEYLAVNSKTGRIWMGNLSYRMSELGLDFGWNVEHVESTISAGSRGDREKASFTVHDAFVRYVPTSDALDERLSLNLSVSNVFDTAYYEQTTFAYLSGYAAPGRDMTLTVGYEF